MIAWLEGKLLSKQAPLMVIAVNGVGYELEAPMTVFYELPDEGQVVALHTHMVVREDAQLLFGFTSTEQRDVFRSLIKTSGIGPKVALAILSTMTIGELVNCIANEDKDQLTKVPGIGAKTAMRLLVELKGRLENELSHLMLEAAVAEQGGDDSGLSSRAKNDAIEALVSLGYKAADARKVVSQVVSEGDSSEQLIKNALRVLSGRVL